MVAPKMYESRLANVMRSWIYWNCRIFFIHMGMQDLLLDQGFMENLNAGLQLKNKDVHQWVKWQLPACFVHLTEDGRVWIDDLSQGTSREVPAFHKREQLVKTQLKALGFLNG